MIKHNQYYTSKNISDLVTKMISIDSPQTCLELSAGEGALLESVKIKWPSLHCTTFDIDPKNFELLRKKYPSDEHFCTDATGKVCRAILHGKKFDLAVCNPPFSLTTVDEIAKDYLKEAFGDIFSNNKKIRSEVLFLAINMSYLNDTGIVAFIVPELIMLGHSFEKLRSSISKNFTVKYVIECDHRSFSKTEAKTYVLILKKSPPDSIKKYKHIKTDRTIKKIHEKDRDIKDFITRQKKINKRNDDYVIIRGSLSGKNCKHSGLQYLHTTNMADDFSGIELENRNQLDGFKHTASNDIVIARVGSRVIGKTNIVKSGNAIISDCIFIVRFRRKENHDKFLSYWKENRNQWLSENSTGTCAKHITITNLSLLIDSIL